MGNKVFILSIKRGSHNEVLGRFKSMEQVLRAYHAWKVNPLYTSITGEVLPLSIESGGRTRFNPSCFVVKEEEPLVSSDQITIDWKDHTLTTRVDSALYEERVCGTLKYVGDEVRGEFQIVTNDAVDSAVFKELITMWFDSKPDLSIAKEKLQHFLELSKIATEFVDPVVKEQIVLVRTKDGRVEVYNPETYSEAEKFGLRGSWDMGGEFPGSNKESEGSGVFNYNTVVRCCDIDLNRLRLKVQKFYEDLLEKSRTEVIPSVYVRGVLGDLILSCEKWQG